jgi:hypothetical protein
MLNAFKKAFRKFGAKTVRIHAVVLRHPTRTESEIRTFLDGLYPQIEAGALSSEEFEKRSREFYGDGPLVFIGYVGLNKQDGKFHLVNPENGAFVGLPLAGDKLIRIDEFEDAMRAGHIKVAPREDEVA